MGRRPVAIMPNNLKEAQPQLGQSQADIIYEALEEGGITRMMGVYQSLDGVGWWGLHPLCPHHTTWSRPGPRDAASLSTPAAATSPNTRKDAYGKNQAPGRHQPGRRPRPLYGATPWREFMWRDPARKKNNGSVHSVVTTGEKIQEVFANASFRTEHEDGFVYEMAFAEDGTPAGGAAAGVITVPFPTTRPGNSPTTPGPGST